MKWEKVRLGDVCIKIGSGSTPKGGSKVYVKNGIAFIRSQNVYNLFFDYNGLVYINDKCAEQLKNVSVEKFDVLLNITGDSVARTCIIPTNVIPARVSQHVSIIRPIKNVLNPFFLNYYLATPFMQSFMLSLAVGKGASRNALTKNIISNFEIPCPTIDIQNRIVNILSAYDGLIENNQKQIKLLEESAQRLYKEWFVNLRFPGYENTPIIDGVPEGWSKGCVGDIAVFKRGKTITKTQIVEGNVPVVSGGLEPAYYHNKANTIAPVITVSASGANAGFTKLYYNNVFASDCSFADAKTTPCLYYIYAFLKDNKLSIDALQKGSAQPHVYAKDINAMGLIIPCKQLILDYCYCVSGIFSKIKILFDQINKLTEARDRVLSKLVNGEIEG